MRGLLIIKMLPFILIAVIALIILFNIFRMPGMRFDSKSCKCNIGDLKIDSNIDNKIVEDAVNKLPKDINDVEKKAIILAIISDGFEISGCGKDIVCIASEIRNKYEIHVNGIEIEKIKCSVCKEKWSRYVGIKAALRVLRGLDCTDKCFVERIMKLKEKWEEKLK